MVGHTGDIEATIVGCKAADEAVKVHVWNHLSYIPEISYQLIDWSPYIHVPVSAV
jgi:hypothetical protein